MQNQQKSITNRGPRQHASWHRYFIDFGGFWEASWAGKPSQDVPKVDFKKHPKNDALGMDRAH